MRLTLFPSLVEYALWAINGFPLYFTPTSPITGSTVTGLTTPTYTIIEDSQPNLVSRQWYVSALGGTQTGVSINSVEKPFTISFFRPEALAVPPGVGTGGLLGKIGRNAWKIVVRKGGVPDVGSSFIPYYKPEFVRLEINLSSLSNAAERKALWSAFVGFVWGNSDALYTCFLAGSTK